MAEYVRDTFTRSVGSGWGTAEVGGAWSEALTNVLSSIAGTTGRLQLQGNTLASVAHERAAAATSARDAASAVQVRMNAGTLTTNPATGINVWSWLRASGATGTPAGVYAKVNIRSDGSMTLTIGYSLTGTPVQLASRSYPAGTAVTGTSWVMELQANGAPTQVRARLWPAATIPTGLDGWLVAGDETGPQVAGVYAVAVDRAAPTVATAHTVDLWEYFATDVPAASFSYAPGGGIRQVQFDGTGSTGDVQSYAWAFGDGTTGTGSSPLHTYPIAGTFNATLTITTRWGATYQVGKFVTVTADPPPGYQLEPLVLLGGVDVCDKVYSASWGSGGTHWTDTLVGQTASVQLRGRYPAIQGQALTITAPTTPSSPLFSGIVDQVTEEVTLDASGYITTVIAMDMASYLARQHLEWATILPIKRLAGRLADLVPSGRISYRAKWSGIASARYPELRKMNQPGDKLANRSYLDMVNEALNASLAVFAYTARDGAIVYGPLDAPHVGGTVPTTGLIDLSAGIDCASHANVDDANLDGLVNRWTYGDGDALDYKKGTSMEAYGEHAYTTAAGVLLDYNLWPLDQLVVRFMAEPAKAIEVEVPIVDLAQKAVKVEPLDLARFEGDLYTVMGVRHESSHNGAWRATLTLDRNPWATWGGTPP